MTTQDQEAAAMSKEPTGHESAAGGEKHTSPARTASASPKRAALVSALSQKSPKEVVGCLDYQAEAVRLRAWPSEIVYRLQARPLLFAQHANQLVHLTGYVGSVVPGQPSTVDSPSFVVDTVDELAPNCHEQITPALLRKISAADSASSASLATAKIATTMGMTEMAFARPKVTIQVGEAVSWKNTSQTVHNVVDDPVKAMIASDVQRPEGAKPFASGLLQPGQSYTHVFSTPGVYRYVCTLHEGSGMKGEVIVK